MDLILEILIEVFGEFFAAVLLEAMPRWLRKAVLAALFAASELRIEKE